VQSHLYDSTAIEESVKIVGENEEKEIVNQNTNPNYREDEKIGETIEVEGKRLWSDVVRGEGYVEGEQGNRK
jgi:hypothetical protein